MNNRKISNLADLEKYLDTYSEVLDNEEDEIIDRIKYLNSKDLCHIKVAETKVWLEQFRSKKSHHFMSLYILQGITYRNYEMLESAFVRTFSKELKNIFEEYGGNQKLDVFDWIRHLKQPLSESQNKHNVVFYSINKTIGNVTQSSNTILRRLQAKVIEQKRILQDVDAVKKNYKDGNIVVFIDDFLGSGQQAIKFFKENKFDINEKDTGKLIYIPFMALKQGVDNLEASVPYIKVFPCEILFESTQISTHFSISDFIKPFNIKETDIDMKKIYTEMRDSFSFFSEKMWLGYKQAQLLVVFKWGCPNQTLPIIYHDKNKPDPKGKNEETFNALALRRGV